MPPALLRRLCPTSSRHPCLSQLALQTEPRCGLAAGEHAHKHEGEQQLSSATTVSAEPYLLWAAGSKDPRGAREFQNAQSLRKQRFSLSITCPSGPADQGHCDTGLWACSFPPPFPPSQTRPHRPRPPRSCLAQVHTQCFPPPSPPAPPLLPELPQAGPFSLPQPSAPTRRKLHLFFISARKENAPPRGADVEGKTGLWATTAPLLGRVL